MDKAKKNLIDPLCFYVFHDFPLKLIYIQCAGLFSYNQPRLAILTEAISCDDTISFIIWNNANKLESINDQVKLPFDTKYHIFATVFLLILLVTWKQRKISSFLKVSSFRFSIVLQLFLNFEYTQCSCQTLKKCIHSHLW